MPGAARLTDICTGHGCWPPRANASASSDVFANSLGAHRVGDAWQAHCCPGSGCHGGVLAAGSPNIFANGRAWGRCGDPVSCGSSVATCSGNVILN